MNNYELIQASAHYLPMLASGSVQAIITSPPYWGLRKYDGDQDVEWPTVEYAPMPGLAMLRVPGCEPGCQHEWVTQLHSNGHGDDGRNASSGLQGSKDTQAQTRQTGITSHYCAKCGGWRGPLGLEPTPEAYVAHLILCLREWRRILRDDGLCWVNLGDSYNSSTQMNRQGGVGRYAEGNRKSDYAGHRPPVTGLKNKNLMLIPSRFALAAQADGWYVRSDIIWHKPNPMPESVTDRPTKAHEYIFMLAKSERYYYDADAIREPYASSDEQRATAEWVKGWATEGEHAPIAHAQPKSHHGSKFTEGKTRKPNVGEGPRQDHPGGRNKRDVWTIASEPYPGAHFATFPEALVTPMILASTSERGCCPTCGRPWVRVVERTDEVDASAKGSRFDKGKTGINGNGRTQEGERYVKVATGWQPACKCPPAEPVACTVLDPFSGSGTTLRVANRYGRKAIGIDLSATYLEQLAPERLEVQPYLIGVNA